MIEVISTFPTVQVKLEDGTVFEFLADTLSIYAAGDLPGCAKPLNTYELAPMYNSPADIEYLQEADT